MPGKLSSSDNIFEFYQNNIFKMNDFGNNWDAFKDCLFSLEELEEYTLVLLHDEIPALDYGNLSIYLDILNSAIPHWQKHANLHHLQIAFLIDCKDAVERCLENNLL